MYHPGPMRSRALLLLSLLGATGCAPALSTFQPAHVPKKHHVQAEIGSDFSIPTGSVGDIVDAAIDLADTAYERELTEEEKLRIVDAAAALGIHAPSPVPHIGVAFAPFDRFEVGLRYSGSAFRLGVRGQFLEKSKHGVDMSAGLGVARFTYSFPVSDVLGILKLEDFERWQFDLPILFGTRGDYYRVWGGPKAMFTTYKTAMILDIPEIPGVQAYNTEVASFDGTAFYLGAQGGAAVGYKYIFIGFELSLAYLSAASQYEVLNKPVRDVNLSTLIIAPGFALMGEF